MKSNNYQNKEKAIIKELNLSLGKIRETEIIKYEDLILNSERIFFVGVGRVKLMLEAASKRFTHLGFQCCVVGEVNELPITKNDLLIVGSGSGESIFPRDIAQKAKLFGARVAHLTTRPESTIAKLADCVVRFDSPSKFDDTSTSVQPMTTLFEQNLLLFNDIIALQLADKMNLDFNALKARHANLE